MTPIVLYAVPGFLALIALEAWFSRRRRDGRYGARDSAANVSLGLGNLATNLAWKLLALAALQGAYSLTPLRVPVDAVWGWVLLFFLEDLCYYVFHRVSHRSRLFWASHVVHHSSERFNLTTAVRQTWTGGLTGWVFWVPLALLGFHPLAILTQQAVNLIYQFWIHTPYVRSLGPLEWVLNTPSHHRVHHGRNPRYIDRNYAGTLIVWDRLFGTFEPEGEPVEYGITRPPGTYNPVLLAFREWRDMLRDAWRTSGWRARLGQLLGLSLIHI